MSHHLVGWVLDKDTAKRRLQVQTSVAGGVACLTVEVYGQQACMIELDADGVVILRGLLGQALERAAAGQERA